MKKAAGPLPVHELGHQGNWQLSRLPKPPFLPEVLPDGGQLSLQLVVEVHLVFQVPLKLLLGVLQPVYFFLCFLHLPLHGFQAQAELWSEERALLESDGGSLGATKKRCVPWGPSLLTWSFWSVKERCSSSTCIRSSFTVLSNRRLVNWR